MVALLSSSGIIVYPIPLVTIVHPTSSETVAHLILSETVATTLYLHPQVLQQQNTTIIKTTTSETNVDIYYLRVQNYNFASGIQATSSAYLTIDGVRSRDYETKVAKTSNGELKIYCEADLIQ